MDKMEFRYVPPGSFLMGSADEDEMAFDDEKPLHQVDLVYGYWLTSLKQWQAQATVSSEEFDRAYTVIYDATLSEWAWVGLVELRAVVTGDQVE